MNTVFFSIFLDAFLVILLIWCACIDWKSRSVSNLQISLVLLLGLVHMAIIPLASNTTWWLYPAGLILSIPFLIAWLKNSMGAADVKLIMAISLYLGLLNMLISFALMIPMLTVITAYSWVNHMTLKYRIPLAPIIAFGAIATVVSGYLNLLL